MSDELLTSAQEVADFLGVHLQTLHKMVREYPPGKAEVFHKLNGRWSVRRSEVLRWHEYVRRQQTRHPEARRHRPEEPPEVARIQGRSGGGDAKKRKAGNRGGAEDAEEVDDG